MVKCRRSKDGDSSSFLSLNMTSSTHADGDRMIGLEIRMDMVILQIRYCLASVVRKAQAMSLRVVSLPRSASSLTAGLTSGILRLVFSWI